MPVACSLLFVSFGVVVRAVLLFVVGPTVGLRYSLDVDASFNLLAGEYVAAPVSES